MNMVFNAEVVFNKDEKPRLKKKQFLKEVFHIIKKHCFANKTIKSFSELFDGCEKKRLKVLENKSAFLE